MAQIIDAGLTQLSSERSLQEITTLASLRVRIAQASRTGPVVLIATAALFFALRGSVDPLKFGIWSGLMVGSTVIRTILCQLLRSRLQGASAADLQRYEGYLFASAVLNAIAMGSSFWLVANTGDLTVRLVITLISCFYGIGTLVNASSHFSSFVIVSAINLGQGVLFWLGIGSSSGTHLEVAFPFLAVSLLIIGFGLENSRQFRESLRIRTENLSLLRQLESEKATVEKALEDARLASESKSQFLAAASHDLRQPLHAMTMFLGTLSFHVSTDDARRLLRRVKETANVLQEQFNSLLDLSKFDAGAVQAEITTFRLDRLIAAVVEEYQPEARARKLILSGSTQPATVRSDATLIARVLRNLVANAVKYTIFGSVVVTVQHSGAEYVVDVIDTGPGIPEDQQEKIFEEYVQLANPARQRRKGVGLGLAIIKRIDLLLNLRLTLQSALGIGSRFRFYLPTADKAEAVPDLPREIMESSDFTLRANVWILDDDPDVLEGLQEQLLAWGAAVEAFSDPSDMLEQLRSGAALPHWILTDDMLGSALTGLETAQILTREFGVCKVCLLTGNTEAQRLTELRDSGFPVIVKPAQPETLMSMFQGQGIGL
jgi:two-component system, sensor histidine kinase